MPLQTKRAGDCRGTESDGIKSDKWCSLCYQNGKFVAPDCTLDQMLEIVDAALREQGSGKIMRWLAKSGVPKLERWSGRES